MSTIRYIHRYFLLKLFYFFERSLKIHVIPVSFYSPIPTLSEIDDAVFLRISNTVGLNWNTRVQLEYINLIFPKYINEFSPSDNVGLSLVDSYILYAMIREKKPKVFIEIGSGESTKISLLAINKNECEGYNCKFHVIEPYPKNSLKELYKNLSLIDKRVQDVDNNLFRDTDMLFIDSSHVSKFDSDVNYEILEIIPKLKINSIIHWHDIMIPMDYHREWIFKKHYFWNESYLLHAFVLFNESFDIVWASKYMSIYHPKEIKNHLPFFNAEIHSPSSFWMQRVK